LLRMARYSAGGKIYEGTAWGTKTIIFTG
jgi:hypothetical protein